MDLSGSSSFRVDSQGTTEHFTLERGRLSAHVAKLAIGQRFIVATPDAEIEVRGTRFRVQVLDQGEICGAGARSRLEVSEGVVEVRAADKTTSVSAGQRWPADCARAAPGLAPAAVSEPPALPVSTRPRISEAARSPAAASRRPNGSSQVDDSASHAREPDSTLTAVNDLFAEGVALRRKGDSEGALRAYQAVIARFPSSPLAENALAERMRILASRHDPRAAREADQYLSRYPQGFAASEARALTVAP
jgi:TolA-binding protein